MGEPPEIAACLHGGAWSSALGADPRAALAALPNLKSGRLAADHISVSRIRRRENHLYIGRGRIALLACGLVVLASVVALIAHTYPVSAAGRRAVSNTTATRTAAACRVRESAGGYPDSYLRRQLPFKVHPPLPVGGWRPNGLAFDVLFHSLFHGYLVIAYRPDLPAAGRASLRTWVRTHRRERVVAVRTREPAAPLVELAEWGWQARCDREPPATVLSRFAARRNG